ncbi:MAG: hypothetical protein IKJ26_10690 [Clostridia bacterium]|nr:hypothetical protein [Clostridia bacterium]
MKIKRFAAVLMMLCLMAGSALAAQFTVEMNGENGVITAVIPDSGSDTLVIPDKAKNEIGEDVPVTKITADFSGCNGLKYILFEGFTQKNFPVVNLKTAPDLECVYFTLEVTEKIIGKVTVNENVELLQRIDLSDKTIPNVTSEYADDQLTIQFPNIIPDGYDGYGYRVTREPIGNPGSEEVFDSERDVSQFGISNGVVTFTDRVDQTASQQSYRYTVTAYEPFGISVMPSASIDVTIPAKPVPAPDPEDPETDPEDPELNPDPEDPDPVPDPEDPLPGPEPAEPAPVPVPAAPDAVPATGDEAAPLLWTALIALSAIGMAALRKRKQA